MRGDENIFTQIAFFVLLGGIRCFRNYMIGFCNVRAYIASSLTAHSMGRTRKRERSETSTSRDPIVYSTDEMH